METAQDFRASLLNHNGMEKQLAIIQGELAELITVISDFYYSNNNKKTYLDVADEVADVHIQLGQLDLIMDILSAHAIDYNWQYVKEKAFTDKIKKLSKLLKEKKIR
jgi:NTP pyrophosphatase (non-canonical NTP hydrolase)